MVKKRHKDNRPNSFLRDGLSIDETRVSLLMITYFIIFIVCCYVFVKTADNEGLKSIFFAILAAVTGINLTNTITHQELHKEDSSYTDNDDDTKEC